LILVDTSIWIDLLAGTRQAGDAGDSLGVARRPLLALPRVSDPVPLATFLHAADIYRLGRRKGYTIRSSTDCLIAAIAVENSLPVWHCDRDFSLIARYTSLDAIERR
jgi:predicted nucleic acid-binding protein